MTEILHDYVIQLIGCILIAMNGYGLHCCKRFIDRLKAKHSDVWLGMGSPELINAENAFEANRLFLFIIMGQFWKRDDPELSRDGVVMQGIIVASIVGVITLFVFLRQSTG